MAKIDQTISKITGINTKTKITDIILKVIIWTFSFITVAILLWILIYILFKGVQFINWEFVSTIYKERDGLTGIYSFIINTIYIVLLTLVISTPIGISTAIYLVEYSKPGKIVNFIRFAIETLAGIPSIIYGLFGFLFFVTMLQLNYSLLAGALTLTIMILPTLIRTTEESLKSVPVSFKEGSLALGATKLKTISKIIIPCAIPGILTAIILSIGRIVGETAALIFTSGINPAIASDIMTSGRTLSLHMYLLASHGDPLEQTFATASILIIIVATINFTAHKLAKGLKKVMIG